MDTLEALCRVLGLDLELHTGPSKSVNTPENSQIAPPLLQLPDLERHTQGLVRVVAAAGGDPIPPDLRRALIERRAGRRAVEGAGSDLVLIPFARDVRAAAGEGEPVWDETEEMAVSVARAALAPWARPERLRCARVAGDSMTPALRDGDLAAVDRGRTEPIEGEVFAVRTAAGLAVKRLRRLGGRWHLTSDNADYPPRPVAADRLLGQVAWTGPPAPRRG